MYNVLVIGAGSIGALKNSKYDSPNTKSIITWAHAAYANPNTNLVGIVDSDKEKAIEAAEKWSTQAYFNISSALSSKPDIIIVATPTDVHWNTLFDVIHTSTSKKYTIIAEKPFCSNTQDAITISKMSEKKNIPIIIDYLRRYNKAIRDVKKALEDGYFGEVFNCVIHYTRGFVRDGSHAMDLCRCFFGDFIDGRLINKKDAIDDYSKNDLTYAAWMEFEKCPFVYFCPVDGRAYDIFNIDIYTKKGRILLTDHGKRIMYFDREPETTYGNYDCLSTHPKIVEIGLETTMMAELDNAIAVLEGKEKPICGTEDAIKVHEIINYMKGEENENTKNEGIFK